MNFEEKRRDSIGPALFCGAIDLTVVDDGQYLCHRQGFQWRRIRLVAVAYESQGLKNRLLPVLTALLADDAQTARPAAQLLIVVDPSRSADRKLKEAPIETEENLVPDLGVVEGVNERVDAAGRFGEHGRHHRPERLRKLK